MPPSEFWEVQCWMFVCLSYVEIGHVHNVMKLYRWYLIHLLFAWWHFDKTCEFEMRVTYLHRFAVVFLTTQLFLSEWIVDLKTSECNYIHYVELETNYNWQQGLVGHCSCKWPMTCYTYASPVTKKPSGLEEMLQINWSYPTWYLSYEVSRCFQFLAKQL